MDRARGTQGACRDTHRGGTRPPRVRHLQVVDFKSRDQRVAARANGIAIALVAAFIIGLIVGPVIVDSIDAWRLTRDRVAHELGGRLP